LNVFLYLRDVHAERRIEDDEQVLPHLGICAERILDGLCGNSGAGQDVDLVHGIECEHACARRLASGVIHVADAGKTVFAARDRECSFHGPVVRCDGRAAEVFHDDELGFTVDAVGREILGHRVHRKVVVRFHEDVLEIDLDAEMVCRVGRRRKDFDGNVVAPLAGGDRFHAERRNGCRGAVVERGRAGCARRGSCVHNVGVMDDAHHVAASLDLFEESVHSISEIAVRHVAAEYPLELRERCDQDGYAHWTAFGYPEKRGHRRAHTFDGVPVAFLLLDEDVGG